MRKVITIPPVAFHELCCRLEELARGYHPDLIVGIASGGARVAREIFPEVRHIEVECRRASTRGKEKHRWLFKALNRLPVEARDFLRIAEARFLRRRSASTGVILTDCEALCRARRVLVVDDAIDSGVTMESVLARIRDVEGPREVRTAVITVTARHPRVLPDYLLFENLELVRFPWSLDATPADWR